MNFQKFLFKIAIILVYIIAITAIIFPLAYIIVTTREGGWKYGFTFIQNNGEVALFVSFAFAFLITMYHALSFDEIGGAPVQNYLKTSQSVVVKSSLSINDLAQRLSDFDEKYQIVSNSESQIIISRKVLFLPPDKISISKNDSLYMIESRPFSKFWFIDFGRNYNNVKTLAKLIKQK